MKLTKDQVKALKAKFISTYVAADREESKKQDELRCALHKQFREYEAIFLKKFDDEDRKLREKMEVNNKKRREAEKKWWESQGVSRTDPYSHREHPQYVAEALWEGINFDLQFSDISDYQSAMKLINDAVDKALKERK